MTSDGSIAFFQFSFAVYINVNATNLLDFGSIAWLERKSSVLYLILLLPNVLFSRLFFYLIFLCMQFGLESDSDMAPLILGGDDYGPRMSSLICCLACLRGPAHTLCTNIER